MPGECSLSGECCAAGVAPLAGELILAGEDSSLRSSSNRNKNSPVGLGTSHACQLGMVQVVSFRDLEVWQLAMDLVDAVIASTRQLPRMEFDLRRQMNRAAISIPSNIAEGWKRKGRRTAYQNHVSIAMGSHAELETQLELCFRNQFLDSSANQRTNSLLNRIGPMLVRLHDSLY